MDGYDGDVDKRKEVVDGIAHSNELQSGVQELLRYARAVVVQLP